MFDKSWLLLVVLVSSVLLVTGQDNDDSDDESSSATSYDLSDQKKMIWRNCPTTGPKAEPGKKWRNGKSYIGSWDHSCFCLDFSGCFLIFWDLSRFFGMFSDFLGFIKIFRDVF